MTEVVFLKLVSGEEIIGGLESDDGSIITVSDPLAMESGVDEEDPSRRYVFMSRYSPYGDNPRVSIRHASVVFQTRVSTTVARYYEVSLKYCERFSDPKFLEGILDTTEQIETSLKQDDEKENNTSRAKEMLVRALTSGPTSNSCH